MKIIEEYFRITGRPISTMTVSEYLEFCKFEGAEIAVIPENRKGILKKTEQESTRSVEIVPSTTIQNPTSDNDTTQTKSNALAMLRSISG